MRSYTIKLPYEVGGKSDSMVTVTGVVLVVIRRRKIPTMENMLSRDIVSILPGRMRRKGKLAQIVRK